MVGGDQITGGHDVLPKPGVDSLQRARGALKVMDGGRRSDLQR